MEKQTYLQLSAEFLQEFEAKIRKDERDRLKKSIIDEEDYIGLEYALGFMTRIMLLNKNGIKKYLYECNVLDMVDGKYVPKNKSKYIDGVICIKKSVLVMVISLNIFVDLNEDNKLDSKIENVRGKNKDKYCMLSYEMHNADEQKNNKKFNRIKTVINKLSSNGDDLND